MMRMRRSRPLSQSAALVACAAAVCTLVAACKKAEPVVVDAGAPPPPVVIDAAPAQLAPLDEVDAAIEVDAGAPAHHHTGPGLSTNQARAKQCCNALRSEAKTDPILTALAAQCDQVAMQIGPTSAGQAPEFGAIRQMLKGHNIPALCSGL
jgi:hypothetical protein